MLEEMPWGQGMGPKAGEGAVREKEGGELPEEEGTGEDSPQELSEYAESMAQWVCREPTASAICKDGEASRTE